jgi:hypothetical protein
VRTARFSLPLVTLSAQHAPPGTDPSLASIILVLAVGILPAVFVAASYHLGYVSSLSISDRSERRGPALFATCCALAAYSVLTLQGAPAVLLSLSAALSFQLAGLALVTNWWRVSYHTASVSGLAFAAQVLDGPTLCIRCCSLPRWSVGRGSGWGATPLWRSGWGCWPHCHSCGGRGRASPALGRRAERQRRCSHEKRAT